MEGLAQRIAGGDVPLALRNAKLLELDLGRLLAPMSNAGEFEERLSMVVQEVVDEAANQPVIMFIDDIHNLIPPPPNGNNGSAILKPALGRGLLRCIGCTCRWTSSKNPSKPTRLWNVDFSKFQWKNQMLISPFPFCVG